MVWLFMFMVGGAAFVGASVALNAMTLHSICTVGFVAICAAISAIVGGFRTLDKISWVSWVGVAGVLSATITLAVAVSRQDRPSAAPATGPWDKDLQVIAHPTFVAGLGAVSNVLFGYAGAPYYYAVVSHIIDACVEQDSDKQVSEMRNRRDYPKSILVSQGVTMGAFIVSSLPNLNSNGLMPPGYRHGCLLLLRPIRLVARPGQRGSTSETGLLRSRLSRSARDGNHQRSPVGQVHLCPRATQYTAFDSTDQDSLDCMDVSISVSRSSGDDLSFGCHISANAVR